MWYLCSFLLPSKQEVKKRRFDSFFIHCIYYNFLQTVVHDRLLQKKKKKKDNEMPQITGQNPSGDLFDRDTKRRLGELCLPKFLRL